MRNITFFLKLAEKGGFEPPHGFTRLLAFQASPFNHLGISPAEIFYHIIIKSKIKMNCFYELCYNEVAKEKKV